MAYVTYQRQVLKNPWIGRAYYLLIVGIAGGSGYYSLIEHRHLLRESITAGVAALYATNARVYAVGPRCGEAQRHFEQGGGVPMSACAVLDVLEATRYRGEALFFTTHVLEHLQKRACGTADPQCLPQMAFHNVPAKAQDLQALPGCLQRSYFVAHIESFGVALEHHLFSLDDPSKSRGVRELRGTLQDAQGRDLRTLSEPTRDVFPLHELLAAAGLSGLEEPSDSGRKLEPCDLWQAKHPEACCEDFGPSLRARGTYVEVVVWYSNLLSGFLTPQEPTYRVLAKRVPHAEAYFTEYVGGCGSFAGTAACNSSDPAGDYRTVRLLTGVQVSVRLKGDLGHWDNSSLLFWLVGLTAAMTTAWNICEGMVEIIPSTKRELYTSSGALTDEVNLSSGVAPGIAMLPASIGEGTGMKED